MIFNIIGRLISSDVLKRRAAMSTVVFYCLQFISLLADLLQIADFILR